MCDKGNNLSLSSLRFEREIFTQANRFDFLGLNGILADEMGLGKKTRDEFVPAA